MKCIERDRDTEREREIVYIYVCTQSNICIDECELHFPKKKKKRFVFCLGKGNAIFISNYLKKNKIGF